MRKLKSRIRKLEFTAIHEAAHAVVSYKLKRRFEYVTINLGRDSWGHMAQFRRFRKSFLPEREDIIISCAGYAGEILYLGKQKPWYIPSFIFGKQNKKPLTCIQSGAFDDMRQAIKERNLFLRQPFYLGSPLDLIEEISIAYSILSEPPNWRAVERLATTLIDKRTIHYLNACKIMKRAIERG